LAEMVWRGGVTFEYENGGGGGRLRRESKYEAIGEEARLEIR